MLELSRNVRDEICAHAREGYPREVVGVLLGASAGAASGDLRRASEARRGRNVETERAHDRFSLDERDLHAADLAARARGLEIVGFYHSHPDAPARASETDLARTSPWGGYSYPIVSVVRGAAADLRSWARDDDRWVEEPVRLTGA